MAARNLLKATASLAGATILVTLTGIIKTKLQANILGPSGIAITGQLTTFQFAMVAVAVLGASQGIMRYGAQYHAAKDKIGVYRVIFTATTVVTAFSVILIIGQLAFSRLLAGWLFNAPEQLYLLRICVPWTIAGALVLCMESVLQALGNIRSVATTRSIAALGSIVILWWLVVHWKLEGAAIALTLYPLLNYCLLKYVVGKALAQTYGSRPDGPLFDKRLMLGLIGIGIAATLVQFGNMLNMVLMRGLIIGHFSKPEIGQANAGYWLAASALSTQHLAVFFAMAVAYSFPRISAMASKRDICGEINDNLRAVCYVIPPVTCIVVAFGGGIVPLLYSLAFRADTVGLLPVKAFGDMFYVIAFVAGLHFLPMGRLVPYVTLNLGSFALCTLLLWLLLPRAGLAAAPISYAIANGLLAVACLTDQWISIGFRMPLATGASILAAFACIGLAALAQSVHIAQRAGGIAISSATPDIHTWSAADIVLRAASVAISLAWVMALPGVRGSILPWLQKRGVWPSNNVKEARVG